MKKAVLLFLLLLTSITYGQTTLANKLKITGNSTSLSASKVNVQESDGQVNTISKSDLIDVLEYASAINLPTTGVSGKIYVTIDNKKMYRWNGTIYQELALTNISGKEDVSNKQNDLTPDGTGTKYPTVDVVNTIDLQKVLDVNGEAFFNNLGGSQYVTFFKDEDGASNIAKISSNNDDGASEIEIRDTDIVLRNFNQISQENASIGVSEGKFSVFQTGNSGTASSIVSFLPPLVDTTLNFPAKTVSGDYTLATTDEIPFEKVGDDINNNNIGRVLIGDGAHTVDDSALLINRYVTTGGTSLGFHAVRDETLYNTNDTSGLRGYASFDAIPKMQGTTTFNHLHSFQSRPNYSGTGTINALRGFTHQSTITGNVDLHQAIFIDDFLGSGTVNQNVGLYIKPLLKGVSNYAIFSEGIAPSFFGGTLQTNGLVQGSTAKFTSYSGTFGSFTTFDSSGNLMNNPNLTLINGVLSMKYSTAKITSTVASLELNSLNNLLFSTAGVEKARIATNGNFLLGSSVDNGASDKLQVNGTLATTGTIKAGAAVRLKSYTVATLPSGVQGDTAYVTDALTPTYLGTLVGGGSVVTPVFYNGTAWVSH